MAAEKRKVATPSREGHFDLGRQNHFLLPRLIPASGGLCFPDFWRCPEHTLLPASGKARGSSPMNKEIESVIAEHGKRLDELFYQLGDVPDMKASIISVVITFRML